MKKKLLFVCCVGLILLAPLMNRAASALDLADAPAADAQAKSAAMNQIYLASSQLGSAFGQGFGLVFELAETLDRANFEYEEGCMEEANARASMDDPDAALAYYMEAIAAFTNAQAYALEVTDKVPEALAEYPAYLKSLFEEKRHKH
jgi:hypothetical protein